MSLFTILMKSINMPGYGLGLFLPGVCVLSWVKRVKSSICYVRQCSLGCAILLELSRGLASCILLFIVCTIMHNCSSLGSFSLQHLGSIYHKRQCDHYKCNYKSLLSLTFNLITYINTVNITYLFSCVSELLLF